jgi:hypothetical protein
MSGEPLHEASIAIGATVLAANIGVDRIIENLRLGQYTARVDFFDKHRVDDSAAIIILLEDQGVTLSSTG